MNRSSRFIWLLLLLATLVGTGSVQAAAARALAGSGTADTREHSDVPPAGMPAVNNCMGPVDAAGSGNPSLTTASVSRNQAWPAPGQKSPVILTRPGSTGPALRYLHCAYRL